MKFFTTFTLIFMLMLQQVLVFADEEPFTLTADDLVAESAILINEDTGQILFEKNANTPMYPASTTKILTALIILEDCDLNDKVVIDEQVPYVDGSGIALEAGEVLTVNELLHAMLMVSANDAAEALAKFHSGTIETFTDVMNKRAAELGALNSNFENPHGLPNPNHVSTAYDLAIIAKKAMENETFREIVTTQRFTIPANTVKTEPRYLNHTDKFIVGVPGSGDIITVRGENVTKGYEYMTGIKSGYTTIARHCFVGAIEKDGERYISAILKSEGVNMYIDTRNLLDYGLYSFDHYDLFEANEEVKKIAMGNTRQTKISLVAAKRLSVDLPFGTSVDALTQEINMLDDIALPISQGEILGDVTYYLDDQQLCSTNLIAADDYSGEDLIDASITFYNDKTPFFKDKMFYFAFFVKLLSLLLIWRTIMTIIRLKQFKRKRAT